MKQTGFTLIGSTFPESSKTDDPEPARICSGKVVEQKKGSSTDLRMELICFLSVDKICFLDGDLLSVFLSSRSCAKTTAGIRPWDRSLAETRLPVHSLGMA